MFLDSILDPWNSW